MKSATLRAGWRLFTPLALIGLLLAACGGRPAPGVQVPAGSAPSITATTETPTPVASSGVTASAGAGVPSATAIPGQPLVLRPEVEGKITFWHFWSSPVRRNAIRRVIAICQKQLPNITVEEINKPFGDIWTENITAVAAGSGMPDVIVEDRPKLKDRAINGIVQPLQELANADGIDGSEFWPFTWQETLYEGRTYGLPFETDVRVLYYNKSAFREVGLDPDKPPRTWEEVAEYADKLDRKNPDGSYDRIGFFPLFSVGPDVWGYTNGVQWVTQDGEVQLTSPQAAETLDWIKGWIDRYGGWNAIQRYRGQFLQPPNDAFMSGKVAMLTDINGYTSQLNFHRPKVTAADGSTAPLEWGVTHLPYKKERGSWSGGFALSIPRGARHPEAAWEFIKCATAPEAQASWAQDTYSLPANQEAASDPVLHADPTWQLFVDAMEYTNGSVFVSKYPLWLEQLDMRYEAIWRGEVTPVRALEEAQQIIERELNR